MPKMKQAPVASIKDRAVMRFGPIKVTRLWPKRETTKKIAKATVS